VGDSAWGSLIDSYYDVVASPIPTGTTEGPVDGLQRPDITPPATHISLSGTLAVGENITVTWSAADTQSGVTAATLWHRPPRQAWQSVTTQTASAGAFPFSLSQWCGNGFAVRAVDGAGNVEPLFGKSNTVIVDVAPCSYKYLPVLWKQAP
jgi:hypothetical protein